LLCRVSAQKVQTIKSFSVDDKMRIAFISVYNTSCGIATYNEKLLKELSQIPSAEVRVFAEYVDDNDTPSITDGNTSPLVIRCWDRNEHPKRQLLKAIDDYNPDVIHISHEYGFFPKAYQFNNLISTLKIKGYNNIVATMHSVYEHLDKTVQESAGQELIVHTSTAKDVLVKKGINPNKITVIPHGTDIFVGTPDEPRPIVELFNTWHNSHVIFHPGFLFDYKGHLRMLEVISRLKPKYPHIQYVIQGSMNPRNACEHDNLYNTLTSSIKEKNLADNVTINTGFINQAALLSFVRTAKLCVLPYVSNPEHDVYATSGIARLIMATSTPLITSDVHLFDDLDGYVLKAHDNDEFVRYIDEVFTDWKIGAEQVTKRPEFIRQTNWKVVANKTFDLYQRIIQNRSNKY
jgi:glycosyltransferase involved in cell wall biosynthesis